ncbi:MAG: hypothetical protein ACOX4B_09530 [Bacillota bacterium]
MNSLLAKYTIPRSSTIPTVRTATGRKTATRARTARPRMSGASAVPAGNLLSALRYLGTNSLLVTALDVRGIELSYYRPHDRAYHFVVVVEFHPYGSPVNRLAWRYERRHLIGSMPPAVRLSLSLWRAPGVLPPSTAQTLAVSLAAEVRTVLALITSPPSRIEEDHHQQEHDEAELDRACPRVSLHTARSLLTGLLL